MPLARAYPATITAIHDGDTCSIAADLGFNVTYTIDARLYGMNAAELNTDAGKAARDHLAQLAPVGTAGIVVCHGPDKYGGRWDCSFATTTGVDLANQMIRDGYAAAWDGKGPKPVPPWPIVQGVA